MRLLAELKLYCGQRPCVCWFCVQAHVAVTVVRERPIVGRIAGGDGTGQAVPILIGPPGSDRRKAVAWVVPSGPAPGGGKRCAVPRFAR